MLKTGRKKEFDNRYIDEYSDKAVIGILCNDLEDAVHQFCHVNENGDWVGCCKYLNETSQTCTVSESGRWCPAEKWIKDMNGAMRRIDALFDGFDVEEEI